MTIEAAETLARSGKLEQAARALGAPGLGLEKLLENSPRHDLLYSAKALGRAVPAALLAGWRKLASQRRSGALWSVIGAAEAAGGRAKQARSALDKALKLEPNLSEASLLRAFCGLQTCCRDADNRGRKAALADADAALTKRPNDARALRLRAEILCDLDDQAGAEKTLRRALSLEPKNGWARVELADLLCDQNRFEEAWKELSRLKSPPAGDASWYHALRGRAQGTTGRLKEGLGELDTALSLSPRHPVILAWRGEALRALGRFQDALRDFNCSIELDPGFVYAYEWRARLHLIMGEPERAYSDALFLQRENPRHKYAAPLLGEASFKLGRYAEAEKWLRLAGPLHPMRTWNPPLGFWGDLDAALKTHPESKPLRVLAERALKQAGLA